MNVLAAILLLHTGSNQKIIDYEGLAQKVQQVLSSIGSLTSKREIDTIVDKLRKEYPNGFSSSLLQLPEAIHFDTIKAIRPCTVGKWNSISVLREVWSEINGKEVFRVY